MSENEVEILLVEDNPADVELTLHALRHNCVANHIQVARDGEEALDFIFCRGPYRGRSFPGLPKLVLLDLKLPKVDGCEVLAALKRDPRTKLIPVVILTSSKEDKDLCATYELGVNSYVQKPVDFDEFRETVKQLGLYWLLVNELPPPPRLNGDNERAKANSAPEPTEPSEAPHGRKRNGNSEPTLKP